MGLQMKALIENLLALNLYKGSPLKYREATYTISELEKSEKIDKNLLRYLTVKVKEFDLETDYFKKNSDDKEVERKSKK